MDDKIIKIGRAISLSIIFIIPFLLGVIMGIAMQQSVIVSEVYKISIKEPAQQKVLGEFTEKNRYVNPFSVIDVKVVRFPIDQLRGCRNYGECYNFCNKQDNFSTCTAWSQSFR